MRNPLKIPKHTDMELKELEGSLYPSILVEQTSSALLGIVNTIVMGMVSTAALAGVGQINSLNTVIFQFFNSLSQGGTVMVAQGMGAKDKDKIRRSFEQAFMSIIVLSLSVLAIFAVFKDVILTALFGAVEADVMKSSNDYFMFAMFATPLWAVYYQMAGAMRSTGDTKTPMKATIVMNVTNIVCSLLFSVIMKMGSMGAGIALVTAVAAGNVVCVIKLLRKDYHLSLPNLRTYKPDFAQLKVIYSVGVPISIESLMFQGGKLIVQVFVSGMGTIMISAYQVGNSLMSLIQIPHISYNTLIVTLVGRRAGAGGKQRVYDTLDFFLRKSIALAYYVSIICFFFTYPLAWIFTREPEVIRIAIGLMAIHGVFMPFWPMAFNSPQGFKGARETRYSLVVGTISMWVLRVFGSWFFGVFCHMQAYGIFLSMCLDWVVRAYYYRRWFRSGNWLKNVKE